MEILLYSPDRPLVDGGVAFLWLMAVGTIICASLWSDMTATEQPDERYDELSPKVYSVLMLIIATLLESSYCLVQ